MDSGAYLCIHADHDGRPMGLVVHVDGVATLPRH